MQQIQKCKLTILKWIKKTVVKCFKTLYKLLYKKIHVDEKLIIFVAYHGRSYSCNPKALHEYLTAIQADYKMVWALKDTSIKIANAKVIRYNGLLYFYYMAKAKYWFVNCKLPKHILKKKEQYYLQTWHGTPLKRLAHDILARDDIKFYRSEMSFQEMTSTYDDDVAKYNCMLSPNHYSTAIFQSAFQIDKGRLFTSGYPRNDYLTSVDSQQQTQLKKKYNIAPHKKVILYAPTWRDTSFTSKGYTFTLQADFKKWKEVLGEEYVVVFKPHYLIVNAFTSDVSLQDFVIQAKAQQDINELYAMSDILITDYSSVFFDYANLNRPIYFYMFDLQSYQDELRGFYFDIYETLPGDIVVDEVSLLQKIKKNEFDYERLLNFNQQFNQEQDGNCSQKVIDYVFNKEGEGCN